MHRKCPICSQLQRIEPDACFVSWEPRKRRAQLDGLFEYAPKTMRRVRPRVWLWLRTGHQSGRFARRSLSSTSNSKPWGRTQLDGRCSRFGGGVPSSRERESEFLGSVDEFQITYILPAKDAKASIPTNRRVPKALALVESYSVDTKVRFPLATRYIGVLSVRELLASTLPDSKSSINQQHSGAGLAVNPLVRTGSPSARSTRARKRLAARFIGQLREMLLCGSITNFFAAPLSKSL